MDGRAGAGPKTKPALCDVTGYGGSPGRGRARRFRFSNEYRTVPLGIELGCFMEAANFQWHFATGVVRAVHVERFAIRRRLRSIGKWKQNPGFANGLSGGPVAQNRRRADDVSASDNLVHKFVRLAPSHGFYPRLGDGDGFR